MALGTFAKIEEAELKATEIIKSAKREAKTIIEQAEKDMSVFLDDALYKANETSTRRIADAIRETECFTNDSLIDLSNEKESLVNKARANRQAAVSMILKNI